MLLLDFTSVISGMRGAGNGLTANQKPDVWTALGLLKPYMSPALQFLFFGPRPAKKVINKVGKFSWMEDEFVPHNFSMIAEVTLSTTYTLTAPTHILASEINAFNVDDLVLLEDVDRMGIVTSNDGTDVVISKIGSEAVFSGNLSLGSVVKIIASMNAEDASKRTAISTKEIEVYNYLTIMSETVANTGRDQAGEAYTDGLSHAEQVQKKMEEMKFKFERLAMLSLTAGNATSAPSMVKTWGKGLLGMLTTNSVSYSTVGETGLDAFIAQVGEKGDPNRTFYLGSTLYYAIQSVIKAKLSLSGVNQIITNYGVKVVPYVYGPNNIKFVYNPVLDGKYTQHGILINDDKFTGRFMGNDDKGSRKFRMEPNVETPGDDVKETKLLADIGCQYMNEETAGVWYYVSA